MYSLPVWVHTDSEPVLGLSGCVLLNVGVCKTAELPFLTGTATTSVNSNMDVSSNSSTSIAQP